MAEMHVLFTGSVTLAVRQLTGSQSFFISVQTARIKPASNPWQTEQCV